MIRFLSQPKRPKDLAVTKVQEWGDVMHGLQQQLPGRSPTNIG